jgi:uncharacterized protein (DUF433 family)
LVDLVNSPPRDPRDVPNYSVVEAAYWLGQPKQTIRNWLVGTRNMKPVLVPGGTDPLVLSFWNLVECSVLASTTKRFRVRLPEVRKAMDYVRKELKLDRPLIDEDFLTNGKDLFVKRFGKLICANQQGQLYISSMMGASLQRVAWDKAGMATRFSPWRESPEEPRILSVDPAVAFGQPVLAGTSIPAQSIIDRYRANESMDSLAEDFSIARDAIEGLVRLFVQRAA